MFLPRIRAHLSDYSSQPRAFGKTLLRIPASLRIRAVMAKDSTTICPGVEIYTEWYIILQYSVYIVLLNVSFIYIIWCMCIYILIGDIYRYTHSMSQLNLDKLPKLSFSLHFGCNSNRVCHPAQQWMTPTPEEIGRRLHCIGVWQDQTQMNDVRTVVQSSVSGPEHILIIVCWIPGSCLNWSKKERNLLLALSVVLVCCNCSVFHPGIYSSLCYVAMAAMHCDPLNLSFWSSLRSLFLCR